MCKRALVSIAFGILCWPVVGRSEDMVGRVRKAVERSTLDQPGTKPFHLKAVLAPSFERDKASGRTGEVEIWWESPTRWRREVRSAEFHQIEVVDGGRDWQKNEGDYFPEWLREISVALVKPVPPLDKVLEHVKAAQIHTFANQTNINWDTVSVEGDVDLGIRGVVALNDKTDLLFYGGGPGWDFQGHEYEGFHARMVARKVSVGSPEVTAKIVTLEDLGQVAGDFFDARMPGGDERPLRTVAVGEGDLLKNLLPTQPVAWPPMVNGPFEGRATANIVIDRTGKVREREMVVADNPGMREAGAKAFDSWQFQPYLVNGESVQVVATVSMPFHTTRPTGVESFDSARDYFERGRRLGFPASGGKRAYMLRAEFTTRSKDGVQKGRYEDTWMDESHWRREAWLGKSHFVRSQDGAKRYRAEDGSDATILRTIVHLMEPIPAIDTFTESDWRIKRETIDGTPAIRLARGPEDANGKMELGNSGAFWFNKGGILLQAITSGLEVRRKDFADFDGVQVAKHLEVYTGSGLAAIVEVKELIGDQVPKTKFALGGAQEYKRQFTDEVR